MPFGSDNILPVPWFSIAVRMKSREKFLLVKRYVRPLEAAVAPRLVASGIATATGVKAPVAGGAGGAPAMRAGEVDTPGKNKREIGLVPTAVAPPTTFPLSPKAYASCVPSSRANERVVCTTRASISTCNDLRSIWRSRLSTFGIDEGMSLIIRVFDRTSA